MLAQSRFKQAIKQFLDTLNEISNQVITYYFQCQKPTTPYKMQRHLTELYTFVFDNCTAKPSYDEKMFQSFKSALLKHLIKYMDILNNGMKENKVIKTYNLIWESYQAYLSLLSNRIFTYLNRYYIGTNDVETLNEVGKKIFLKTFLGESNLRVFITPYMKQLQTMRANGVISHKQLVKFVRSLSIVDNKTNIFPLLQQIYINQAQKFYQQTYQLYSSEQPIKYFNRINNLKYFEQTLAKHCFSDQQFDRSIIVIFTNQLIKKYTHIFITQPYGFGYLLKMRKIEQLKQICQIYKKMEGFQQLKKFIYSFILEEGKLQLTHKSKESTHSQFIQSFYSFYKKYYQTISEGFTKESELLTSFYGSIQKLMGTFDRITNDLFVESRNALNADKFEEIQQKIFTVFEKLPSKDQFIYLYQSSLQKKIMQGTCSSRVEEKFIKKVHQICNSDITGKLQKILEDFSLSLDLFQLPILNQNFQVKVFSFELWQKKYEQQLSFNLTLIEPFSSKWKEFQTLYTGNFPKKRLILLPCQTKIILGLNHKGKEMKIQCNLLQALIIYFCAYSQKVHIQEDDIVQNLTIQKSFLRRFLDEFPKIITSDSMGFLKFNWDFQTLDTFVHLGSRIQEQKKVTKHIKQDRDMLIQCAIVRIIKKKKELTFEELVGQVTHSIKLFKAAPSNIKSCMEVLEKKDFIELNTQGKICYKE